MPTTRPERNSPLSSSCGRWRMKGERRRHVQALSQFWNGRRGTDTVYQFRVKGLFLSFSCAENNLALRWASEAGGLETVRLLLERGADPNVMSISC